MDDVILNLLLSEEQKTPERVNMTKDDESQTDTKDDSEDEFVETIAEAYSGRKTEDRDNFIFIEERDIQLSAGTFYNPSSLNDLDELEELPIEGSGELIDVIVIGQQSDYDVRVRVDDNEVIDDSYSYIESISGNLSRVSAFQSSGNYVVHVTDYKFTDWFSMGVRPNVDMTFKTIRVEVEVSDG